MRKRSEQDPTENQKLKQNRDLDQLIPLKSSENYNTFDEYKRKMAMTTNDLTNLDDSIGAALIRAFDRTDVKDKFANIFTEKCKIMIDDTLKITDAKIDEVAECTKEHDERIRHLEKMADDNEQDRRGTNLIIKGIKITDTPKIDIANIISRKIEVEIQEDNIKFAVKN